MQANIRGIIVNRMKGPEPSPETLAALVAYVSSIGVPAQPLPGRGRNAVGRAPVAAKRGYEPSSSGRAAKTCHLPPTYDKKDVEDVLSGGKFKVPSLRVVPSPPPTSMTAASRTSR